MKANINSRLFEKKIDIKSSSSILGGRMSSTGSSETTYTGPNGNTDQNTVHYDEDCNVVKIEHCNF